MKRWLIIVLAGMGVLGIGYGVVHRDDLGLTGRHGIGAGDGRDGRDSTAHPATIVWQTVDRSPDGFRVEMPADVKQIQIPAYNESGGTDQVKMVFSNPDAATTFSVAWADNPPVARVNRLSPDQTLEMARDGALARAQTDLVSESASTPQGFPGRDFASRNSGGGVMSSRLIYVGSRLYMLNAAFPSAGARRDRDVNRFFNSFTVTPGTGRKD